jgi:hypothetical protein
VACAVNGATVGLGRRRGYPPKGWAGVCDPLSNALLLLFGLLLGLGGRLDGIRLRTNSVPHDPQAEVRGSIGGRLDDGRGGREGRHELDGVGVHDDCQHRGDTPSTTGDSVTHLRRLGRSSAWRLA